MRFTIPRDIYYGRGSLETLKEVKGKKAVIVVGGTSMQKTGFLDKTAKLLREAGLTTHIFEGVEPDPSIETVMRGAAFMREHQPDVIVSIGGGSPIDAAKAMWIFYEHPEITFDDIKDPFTVPELRKKATFIAIPSTSGTATEVTAFSVITDYETKIKYPLADYNLTPDIAIVDPDLASTMPKELVANTGMDALTHAVEAYVATAATEFTDPLALHAIKLIITNLVKSYEGDKDAAEKMHYAQCMAGMSFSNALLGITHSLAHKTGAALGIPHGLANAIYMPYVIRFNSNEEADGYQKNGKVSSRKKYAEIATYMGVAEKEEKVLVDKLIGFVETINNTLNIPASLREAGVEEMEFRRLADGIAENAAKDPCTGSNPRRAEKEDLKKLLHCIYEGKQVDF
ncbi:iron-containing alcohol dehydrogenase [Sinanaerobacter chloroacetimidivorans]|uniref:Iron-containing alcohol dehydrogenase n=1 Tax=Sinanaerobacter chloroacetimidivorans TaxID=2818044 RepID=A0A8J7VZW6_9FIRM|nr:iron-containing alcohol dehydrogenase [Sinanaerobacter chloroacetimidivorans]MBR0598199.1 iron-containing alcohol dehydrogenase [Sinanaerobacter chloroacetimidivorans]